VNGDVLGATNELSRPLLVLVTLAVMTWMFL
jgi:cobalamin synthase